MNNKVKENAFSDFIEMVKQSWVYERFTDEERIMWEKHMHEPCTQAAIVGSYEQRWKILQAIEYAFIVGLGYHSDPRFK